MSTQDIPRFKKTPATGSDAGNTAITDANIKAIDRIVIPANETNTFNGGKAENGVINLSINSDGDFVFNSYADGKWTEYLTVLDGLKSVGGITSDGNEVNVISPVKWRINSVNYKKLTNTIITVNSATDGYKRIDYIYADTNSNILLIEGTEVADGNPYIPPTLPINTVMVAPVYISGDTVLQPIPDLSNYLTKILADGLYIRVNPDDPQIANMWISGKGSFGKISVGLPPSESGGSLHVRGISYLDASNTGGGIIFYGVGGADNGINIGEAAEQVLLMPSHKFMVVDQSNGLLKILLGTPFLSTQGGEVTGKITGSSLFTVTDPKDYVQKGNLDAAISSGIGVTENKTETSYALTVRGYYNYIGTGNAIWTLPPVATSKGLFYRVYNKVGGNGGDNSGILTIDANGSEELFRGGMWSQTIDLAFGENLTLQCDGFEWNIYN